MAKYAKIEGKDMEIKEQVLHQTLKVLKVFYYLVIVLTIHYGLNVFTTLAGLMGVPTTVQKTVTYGPDGTGTETITYKN